MILDLDLEELRTLLALAAIGSHIARLGRLSEDQIVDRLSDIDYRAGERLNVKLADAVAEAAWLTSQREVRR